jgi:hypothetical protein
VSLGGPVDEYAPDRLGRRGDDVAATVDGDVRIAFHWSEVGLA